MAPTGGLSCQVTTGFSGCAVTRATRLDDPGTTEHGHVRGYGVEERYAWTHRGRRLRVDQQSFGGRVALSGPTKTMTTANLAARGRQIPLVLTCRASRFLKPRRGLLGFRPGLLSAKPQP